MPRTARPLLERFWEKVQKTDTCWLWTGTIRKDKKRRETYGQIVYIEEGAKIVDLAHRVAYRLLVGPIPEGLTIDHTCRNKTCVNPDHLEAVTTQVNTARWKETVTHCVNGHAFDEANTGYGWNKGYLIRYCRECSRIRTAEYRDRNYVEPEPRVPDMLCQRGHPFDEENTGYQKSEYGEGWSRYCKMCSSIIHAERYRRARGGKPVDLTDPALPSRVVAIADYPASKHVIPE